MPSKILPMVLGLLLGLTVLSTSAQISSRPVCGFNEAQALYFATHPQAQAVFDALNQQLAAMPRERGVLGTPTVTVPVVVHVIHGGGPDNISDSQIASAILQMNADFQKLNADTVSLSPLFSPIAATVGFQFKLARKDPNGNCSTGITRRYAPAFVNDDLSGAVKTLDRWDTSRYLNIWVVNTIGPLQNNSSFIQAYSSFPNGDPALDGCVIRHDWFGNQGTSNAANASERIPAHEMGHYFGLLHTWGNSFSVGAPGNCNDTDYVADTPPTNGTFGCNLSDAPCGPVANVQNYMDYTSCRAMFTQGQKNRVLNVLQLVRTGLTAPTNLLATGTNDGYVAPDCAPIAGFAPAGSPNTCTNAPLTLRDCSANFTAGGGQLTYTWSAPGAAFVGSTNGQAVTLAYPAAGMYSVTETVSNRVGSSSSTQTNFIKVEGPTSGENAPYNESFENPGFPNLFPTAVLRNYETGGTSVTSAWRRQTVPAAAAGAACLVVTNRIYAAGTVTTLVTPNLNLSSVPTIAELTFARAYALRSPADNTQLRISFSNDCGTTWSLPSVLNVAQLTTQGATPIDGFSPSASADWQTTTVSIPAQFRGSSLFKVRFQLVNGTDQGNSFFFDNLRLANTLAMVVMPSEVLATKTDALAKRGVAVYPIPLTTETALHLALPISTQLAVCLTDVLGRAVFTLPAKTYGTGSQVVPLLPTGHLLKAGLYVLHLSLNGEDFTTRLTVE